MAERIGKERNIRVIQLTALVSQVGYKDTYDTAGPFEFLSLFCHASHVVTSSFHGCVFSIIFHKLFCFHSNVETERISSLLQLCGLTKRFVTSSRQPIRTKSCGFKRVYFRLYINYRLASWIQFATKNSATHVKLALINAPNNALGWWLIL